MVLQVQAPGTFHGDSGMLWLTQSGQAAAIHARGQAMPGLTGSPITTAMSAARAAGVLGVNVAAGVIVQVHGARQASSEACSTCRSLLELH